MSDTPTMSDAMATATRYHAYLWSKLRPHLGARVLEVGVGFGQYTRSMINESKSVFGIDLNQEYLDRLAAELPPARTQFAKVNLDNPGDALAPCKAWQPDTVLLVNVLEHIEDDVRALATLRDVTMPGGTLAILVPAMPGLYNTLDRDAGHFRRYGTRDLVTVMENAGWQPERTHYINAPGAIGWWLAGVLQRGKKEHGSLNSPLTNLLIKFYDFGLTGIAALTDPLIRGAYGLSVVAAGRRL